MDKYYKSEIGECYTGESGDEPSQTTCDFKIGEKLPKGLDTTSQRSNMEYWRK